MDIQKLASSYQARTKAHFKLIEKIEKNAPTDLVPPNYIKEVIIPIHRLLAEKYPELCVKIPDENNYTLHEGYFQVRILNMIIGGLSYPIANEAKIYFTPLFRKRTLAKRQEITSIAQFHQIITKLLDKKKKSDK